MNRTTYETTKKIARLVQNMTRFWSSSDGWAPIDASKLLSKSMLEWQSSLADCLEKWTGDLTQGERILAWANIGAIVEGQLKLFLAVYYEDYLNDIYAISDKRTRAIIEPDALMLEKLRVFFKSRIWMENEPWDAWLSLVQQKRNAIHAFKARNLGTTKELHDALETLLVFVRRINSQLPYPDGTYMELIECSHE
ncbi:hypothetical protein BJN45_15185 [Azonexus hydrophilus]|uniref:Apea-like HEPN domain-containing protein n=1 Tax=Azonexus hydrophilus TaxID=418702 RepID=A0A1R1I1Y6_9RHOO|nr:hypothetical protein [Azonexus hydrophilus]OMG52614.1 hypothetical protein BJN45_15185 [Azonexus hydrophilus]